MNNAQANNVQAPPGDIWVCGACGKLSYDLYGNKSLSYDWDESCMLNAMLCHEGHVTVSGDGILRRAIEVAEGGIVCHQRAFYSDASNTVSSKD